MKDDTLFGMFKRDAGQASMTVLLQE